LLKPQVPPHDIEFLALILSISEGCGRGEKAIIVLILHPTKYLSEKIHPLFYFLVTFLKKSVNGK